ncbi:MAG: PDZ domain-containing protein [Planctomycetota bacterium]|jgi:S1-C subfamily serine protease
MPPQREQPRGPKFFGLSYERPSAALAAQLGIKRTTSLVVTRVVDDSQAEAAGLKRYDVLTEVAGMKATDKNVSKAKRDRDYGDTVEFQIIRAGKSRKLDIPIGEQKH